VSAFDFRRDDEPAFDLALWVYSWADCSPANSRNSYVATPNEKEMILTAKKCRAGSFFLASIYGVEREGHLGAKKRQNLTSAKDNLKAGVRIMGILPQNNCLSFGGAISRPQWHGSMWESNAGRSPRSLAADSFT
jgi:hypothetical protein